MSSVRRVAATYFSDEQSCVVRRTQFAVREMGSEKTLRRPMTAKVIIKRVGKMKSSSMGRPAGVLSSPRSNESAMAKTTERKNARMTRCCRLRVMERKLKSTIAVCRTPPKRGVQCRPPAPGTRSGSSTVFFMVRT